jgi:hypothetical protein
LIALLGQTALQDAGNVIVAEYLACSSPTAPPLRRNSPRAGSRLMGAVTGASTTARIIGQLRCVQLQLFGPIEDVRHLFELPPGRVYRKALSEPSGASRLFTRVLRSCFQLPFVRHDFWSRLGPWRQRDIGQRSCDELRGPSSRTMSASTRRAVLPRALGTCPSSDHRSRGFPVSKSCSTPVTGGDTYSGHLQSEQWSYKP